MLRGRVLGSSCVALVAALGLAACDDDDEPVVASEETYEDAIAGACDETVPDLEAAYLELNRRAHSDAEEAGFYRAELAPRLRSILRTAASFAVSAEVAAGINDAAQALAEIDADAPGLIDRRRDGNLREDEDPFRRLQQGLTNAGIECAVPATGWEL